ncbi:hypothetical protein SERLA73DRAFT_148993 [Serpula lacrymans var. lacrymans S7.3]|uniref:HMG domain-containing protein n=1 Tax=Serpula lacrymans var. lacrymans (strain S7.3) TaxID=936435 RepID=F8PHJ0_SERL3|nr:hypothetical protein SERLA73DRAFT_148993 [Serpula lacrymans var. lacrymans S7.3]
MAALAETGFIWFCQQLNMHYKEGMKVSDDYICIPMDAIPKHSWHSYASVLNQSQLTSLFQDYCYYLQRKPIGLQSVIVRFCPKGTGCIHIHFLKEYGEESFPVNIEGHHCGGHIIVSYNGSDSGDGIWNCMKDHNNCCNHITKARHHLRKLVTSNPSAQDNQGKNLDPNDVLQVSVLPPSWGILPSNLQVISHPLPLQKTPDLLKLNNTAACICRQDEYTCAYTLSETPFVAFVSTLSQRYQNHHSKVQFISEDAFRTVWFSYALQDTKLHKNIHNLTLRALLVRTPETEDDNTRQDPTGPDYLTEDSHEVSSDHAPDSLLDHLEAASDVEHHLQLINPSIQLLFSTHYSTIQSKPRPPKAYHSLFVQYYNHQVEQYPPALIGLCIWMYNDPPPCVEGTDQYQLGTGKSMPLVQHHPHYSHLKNDLRNEPDGRRGKKCSKYYAQYGKQRLTSGIITSYKIAQGTKSSSYNFACALGPYCLTQEPDFFADTLFVVDAFHAKGHPKCSPAAFLTSYARTDPQLGHINSIAAKCGDSAIKRIQKSVSYMSQDRAILYTKVFLSIWNRLKIHHMIGTDM